MTQFIESFFDNNAPAFKLWSKKVADVKLSEDDIVYKGNMLKMNRKNNKLKERFFILTNKSFYYLKSSKNTKIRGVMDTAWVRVEYILEESDKEKRFCIRFIRNMKYCDFWINDEKLFKEWKRALSKVFIQSDFHIKFNAIKMIGKGSFARVYLVEDKETKAKFAVKAFSKEYLLSQSKGKESLINEIEIMQAVKNPYIMNLEELHESKNSIYLVLELLEGGELFNHISSKNNIGLVDVHRVMRCLLEALAYLADRKIMHRDLKPENMILKDKGKLENCTLKLVDFGLATVCDIPEYLFKRCGTPGYVAPEIINAPSNENIHYTPKCDVFSAGIIFYILLTGKSPFDGKSFQEILNQNKACKIDFKNPKLHKFPHVVSLLQKMLDVNPATRYSAKDALNHEFFKSFDCKESSEELDDEATLSNNLKEFNMKHKLNLKNVKNDNNSFVVKEGGSINGEVNTVNETNSEAGINSFKNVGAKNRGNPNAKRESIYKYVLMKESNANEGADRH
jgi:serine/threonine protein kinase